MKKVLVVAGSFLVAKKIVFWASRHLDIVFTAIFGSIIACAIFSQ